MKTDRNLPTSLPLHMCHIPGVNVAPDVMKIYQLNDCEWWMAYSLEQAIETAIKQTGCTREEVYDPEWADGELTDAQLDKLQFVDTEAEGQPKRSFREQLAIEVAAGRGPGLFASTEY